MDDETDTVRRIYRAHRSELVCYLMQKHRLNEADAEDLVQVVFERFAVRADDDQVANVRAYLYRMANNAAIDRARRQQVQRRHAELTAAEEPEQASGPEHWMEQHQRLGLLARVLWGMPKKRRELLLMSRFDGLSFAEIARRVGLSETVVRKHINNALADCHRAVFSQQESGASGDQQ